MLGEQLLSWAAAIAERRPDVVVAGRESVAFHVPEVARRHGLPCVALIQGPITRAMTEGSYPPALRRRLLGELRKADLLVAVAEHLRAPLGRLGLDRVRVIQNAVDLERFFPGRRTQGCCARLASGRRTRSCCTHRT